MPVLQDHTGRVFGRLRVVARITERSPHKWRCMCECGQVADVRASMLMEGRTRSCGCLRREMRTKANTTHGMTGTPTFISWQEMHTRCSNPSRDFWHRYGGRGITVCKRWNSFEAFYADMGPRPPGTSLERKDGNKGYSKSNCCWATQKEQCLNRSTTRWIEFNGKRRNLTQWAEHLGYSFSGLQRRLNRLPVDQALQPGIYR